LRLPGEIASLRSQWPVQVRWIAEWSLTEVSKWYGQLRGTKWRSNLMEYLYTIYNRIQSQIFLLKRAPN